MDERLTNNNYSILLVRMNWLHRACIRTHRVRSYCTLFVKIRPIKMKYWVVPKLCWTHFVCCSDKNEDWKASTNIFGIKIRLFSVWCKTCYAAIKLCIFYCLSRLFILSNNCFLTVKIGPVFRSLLSLFNFIKSKTFMIND